MEDAFVRVAHKVVLALALALVPLAGIAKDDLVEVEGAVQAMPATGFVGDWRIAGRAVTATAATIVDQEMGRATVGALVEAKGNARADGSLLAVRIEVKQGVTGPTPPGPPAPPMPPGDDDGVDADEFSGAIEALPATGLLGDWRVAGRTVSVVSTTRLDQERGGFAVGTIVEVHGMPDASGKIVASEIEVRSAGAPVRPPHPDEFEITGRVEALPAAGLLGTWRVAGRDVVVGSATTIDQEHGPIAVGTLVEVHGAPAADGTIAATRVESEEGNGADEPALEFFGAIEALPPAANGFRGVWRVAGRTVNVSDATRLVVDDGPFAVGAIVEVSGWPQPDGVIEAHEIETRHAVGEMRASGPVAVEFENRALGHFFVTAFPAEIAALDAGAFGGAWRRTGASFKVGAGTASVCRFYGAPPKGPDSHFFTADAAECAKVMRDYRAWTFEAHAFSIDLPVAGTCAAGRVAVHRFYNDPAAGAAMNHRYVADPAIVAQMQAAGWVHEGVVMCAQP